MILLVNKDFRIEIHFNTVTNYIKLNHLIGAIGLNDYYELNIFIVTLKLIDLMNEAVEKIDRIRKAEFDPKKIVSASSY